jgi:hypothetical protein
MRVWGKGGSERGLGLGFGGLGLGLGNTNLSGPSRFVSLSASCKFFFGCLPIYEASTPPPNKNQKKMNLTDRSCLFWYGKQIPLLQIMSVLKKMNLTRSSCLFWYGKQIPLLQIMSVLVWKIK